MKLASVRAIVEVLNSAGVRFLVAGGLAVNAHGYHRFTKDVDLVVELTDGNIAAAFTALAALGYRPLVPITADQFADRELREMLIRDKNMRVLQFWSDDHPETPIDVFVRDPFPFEREYPQAAIKELAGAGPVHIVSIRTLIRMKEQADRPEDRMDIRYLKMLLEDQ